MKTNKSISVYILIILLLFIGLFVIFSKPTQATVPVEVMKGTLDGLNDITDTDKDADLQSKIIGEEKYTEGEPLDVTITRTQKLGGNSKDKKAILDDIIKNINKRISETKDAKEKTELEKLKTQTETLKDQLVESVALDVNIVKNSSQAFEELRNVAREQLARKQVGKLSKQLTDAYEAAGILYTDATNTKKNIVTNYKDFLFEEPLDRARNYLDEHFTVNSSILTQTELDATKEMAIKTLEGGYRNAVKPEKTLAVAIEDVLDASKGGGWDQWLLLFAPNNNPYGIFASALESAKEVADEAFKENVALNIAGQGTLPLTRKTGQIAADASPKYEIIESAGVVKEYPIIAAQGQMTIAADPKTASIEEETIYPPDYPLTPPWQDTITGGGSEYNVEWQTDTLYPVIRALEDVLSACFPDAPWDFGDLFPDLGDIFPEANIPTGLEICGQYFDFCGYFPDVCEDLFSVTGTTYETLKRTIEDYLGYRTSPVIEF